MRSFGFTPASSAGPPGVTPVMSGLRCTASPAAGTPSGSSAARGRSVQAGRSSGTSVRAIVRGLPAPSTRSTVSSTGSPARSKRNSGSRSGSRSPPTSRPPTRSRRSPTFTPAAAAGPAARTAATGATGTVSPNDRTGVGPTVTSKRSGEADAPSAAGSASRSTTNAIGRSAWRATSCW